MCLWRLEIVVELPTVSTIRELPSNALMQFLKLNHASGRIEWGFIFELEEVG